MSNKAIKLFQKFHSEGFSFAAASVFRWLKARREEKKYRKWIKLYDTLKPSDINLIRTHCEKLEHKPLISVLMPVYNTDEIWLRKAIESVTGQIYPYWELCIADDCSTREHIRHVLTEYEQKDSRIKVIYREENGHISAASNSALELVTGEFSALLDHDDELSANALYAVAKEINRHPASDMIYSDEDLIDANGKRFGHRFKPDWSRDLMYSGNLVTHLCVFRTSILKEIGGFRIGYEGSQDYDLTLRVIEQIPASNIRHIPRILYHWRAIPGSVAYANSEKGYALSHAREAIRSHFERCGVKAHSEAGSDGVHRTVYELPEEVPLVSIIVFADEKTPLDSLSRLLNETDYKKIELVIIGCGSKKIITDVKYVELNGLSGYAAINLSAGQSTGSILCFLDPTTKVKTGGWLTEAVSQAIQKDAGAVGIKVVYTNNTIKHGGLILGINGGLGRAHHKFPGPNHGYALRLKMTQNFSAVAIDCLTIRRSIFDEAGGFNNLDFPDSYGDVDLCLRLLEKGYRNVWTPWAEIMQGDGRTIKNHSELNKLKEKWAKYFIRDPFYNPNLTRESEVFSLSFPPLIGDT